MTRLDGWPVRVRHDTVDLQVARWYAGGRGHDMKQTNFTVVVPPETRATIRNPQASANDSFTALLVGALVLAAVVLLLGSKMYEDY